MSCEAEAFVVHRPLVDRCSHEDVDISVFEVFDALFKGGDSRFCRFGSRQSGFDERIFRNAVQDVYPSVVCVPGIGDHVRVDLPYVVQLFFVKAEYLG